MYVGAHPGDNVHQANRSTHCSGSQYCCLWLHMFFGPHGLKPTRVFGDACSSVHHVSNLLYCSARKALLAIERIEGRMHKLPQGADTRASIDASSNASWEEGRAAFDTLGVCHCQCLRDKTVASSAPVVADKTCLFSFFDHRSSTYTWVTTDGCTQFTPLLWKSSTATCDARPYTRPITYS